MKSVTPLFDVSLAQSPADREQAMRLRYTVFVEELGGDGPLVDHARRLEQDRFDPGAQMLVLRDLARPEAEQIVGVYRLLQSNGDADQEFYSAGEYDLAPLIASGQRLLELGRSCLHPDYRGGSAVYHLWHGLADYVQREGIDILFGVASFHGTKVDEIRQSLSYLHHKHLAPEPLRVTSRQAQSVDLVPKSDLDRVAAIQSMPALIKGYLRLGGCVGQGVYVDHAFNTIDVCLVMETSRLNDRQKAIYFNAERG